MGFFDGDKMPFEDRSVEGFNGGGRRLRGGHGDKGEAALLPGGPLQHQPDLEYAPNGGKELLQVALAGFQGNIPNM